jgi:hypothetical protein
MEWTQLLVLVFGNLAVILPLWLWSRAEARTDARKANDENTQLRRDLVEAVRSIDREMKDFHTRLALQDQEFKMRLCSIEENMRARREI